MTRILDPIPRFAVEEGCWEQLGDQPFARPQPPLLLQLLHLACLGPLICHYGKGAMYMDLCSRRMAIQLYN